MKTTIKTIAAAIIMMIAISVNSFGQSFIKKLTTHLYFSTFAKTTNDELYFFSPWDGQGGTTVLVDTVGNVKPVSAQPEIDSNYSKNYRRSVVYNKTTNDFDNYLVNNTTLDSVKFYCPSTVLIYACFKINNYYYVLYDWAYGSVLAKVTSPTDPIIDCFFLNFTGTQVGNLCMVSYSTNNSSNVVVCEPTDNVKSFLIYKETTVANKYQFLGSLSGSNYVFEDTNKYTQAVKYAICGINECGDTSLFSEPHKTIHLQSNIGVNGEINLSWNAYEGFAVSTYRIWRNNVLLDSVSGSFNAYTDYKPLTGVVNYQIEVIKTDACEIPSTKKGVTVYGSTYSNKIKVDKTNGINETSKISTVALYPNPATTSINFNVSAVKSLSVISYTGSTVEVEYSNGNVNVSNLSSGMYFINIYGVDGKIYNGKFIKE